MQKIRQGWSSLSERNRALLVFFVIIAFCGNIHTRWSKSLFYFFLMPVFFTLCINQYRQRLTRRTPHLALSVAATLWMLFSYMLNDIWDAGGMFSILGTALCWLYVLHLPENTDMQEIHRQLFSFGCAFIIFFMPFMLAAIFSIFTGYAINIPANRWQLGIQRPGMVEDRIFIMMNPNYMGRITSYNILISIYALVTRGKKKWVKPAFIFVILVNLIIFVHSQSRTSYISFAFALGILVFRLVFNLLRSKRALRVVAGLLACAIVFFVALEGFNLMLKLDVAIAHKTAVVEPAVRKDGTVVQQELSRVEEYGQFDVGSSGRGEIWTTLLTYLKDHPRYLLTGMGTGIVIDTVDENNQPVQEQIPPHSSYIGSLCRGGVPFMLIVFAFLCLMIRPVWRMLTDPVTEENRGLFVIAVFVPMMLVMGIPEVYLFIGMDYSHVIFMMMCGFLLHYDYLKNKKTASR